MECDVAIIGSGPGGYVAAIRAAQVGLKTVCIEKSSLGGTCLNVGCIPSKALLHITHLLYECQHKGKDFGIKGESLQYDFTQMMNYKSGVIKDFNQGIGLLFQKNKIKHLQGRASFVDANTLEIEGSEGSHELKAKYIIIATGSEPVSLPCLKFDEEAILSSTGALALKKVPSKLIVIGAGVIGVEIGSVYSRLGSDVEYIEFCDRICPAFDPALSKALENSLKAQGHTFHLNTKVTGAHATLGGVSLNVEGEVEGVLSGDAALVAVGRRAYTEGLNLEAVGITLDDKGVIPINDAFQTAQPNIFAIGDVIDGPMLAHKASEEGVAVAELIAGLRPHISYIAIPSVIYTDPEVASVGLTETAVKEHGLIPKVGRFPFKGNSRAKAISQNEGFIKIVAAGDSDVIVGMHIIGPQAGELIAIGMMAISQKMRVQDLAELPFAHPTLSESVKEAALAVSKMSLHS